MVFKFLFHRTRPKHNHKRRKKSISNSKRSRKSQISREHETRISQSLDTVDTNQVLARLDVIMGFLREHHSVIKNQVQQTHSDLKEQLLTLGMAKKIIKQTSLDRIVQEKLSHGEKKSQIVRQLTKTGACSRATAYRILERNETSKLSQMSQVLSQ